MNKEQIEKLLADMTLEEKVFQLVQVPGNVFDQKIEDTGTDTHLSMDRRQMALLGSTLSVSGAEKLNHIQKEYLEQNPHHIPLLFMMDVIHGFRTIFPMTLGLGAAFDPELVEKGAEIAANECSAAGIQVTFSPMVDIARDARWGRIMESTGEDPFLNSEMAKAHVRGFQGPAAIGSDVCGSGDAESGRAAACLSGGTATAHPYKDHVSACIKHYAAYGASEAGRDYNITELSEHTLRNAFLPPYEAGVKAGADMIMTSFNAWNGETTSSSSFLLRKVLREEWGFDGVVISDWNAVGELVEHGLCADLRGAAKLAIEAGVDIDMCSGAYAGYLEDLVKSGEVPERLVDEAALRVLLLKNKLGLFENPYKDSDPAKEKERILCKTHREAARKAVTESAVLLKNEQVLPLKQGEKIALIGPYVDEKEIHSFWAIAGKGEDAVSVAEAAKERESEYEFLYAQGCGLTRREDLAPLAFESRVEDARQGRNTDAAGGAGDAGEITGQEKTADTAGKAEADEEIKTAPKNSPADEKTQLQEAVSAAAEADSAVVFIGEHRSLSGESASRGDITVPEQQLELLRRVAQVNSNVTAVIFTGRPLDLREVCACAGAVLVVWMPGTEGGHGIMDLLTGTVSPSGKLPATMPYCAAQEPVYYNHINTGRPKPADLRLPIFTSAYMDMPNRPLFPFGYGLSYTTFSYSPVKLSKDRVLTAQKTQPEKDGQQNGCCTDALLTASVTVKNTGSCEGTEVVQMYIHDKVSSRLRPVRELKGFRRVTLTPGQETEVSFAITGELLSFTGMDGKQILEPGEFEVWIGGDSDTENKAVFCLD